MRSTSTSLWRVPAFQRLWAAGTISSLGTAVTALALPLVAQLELGASALEMWLLVAIERGPIFIFGLFAGIWIDRRLSTDHDRDRDRAGGRPARRIGRGQAKALDDRDCLRRRVRGRQLIGLVRACVAGPSPITGRASAGLRRQLARSF